MHRSLVFVLCAITLTWACQVAASSNAEYRQWLEAAYPSDGPGAAVIVVKDNEVIFRDAVGMADLELGIPLQPHHVFRIGSVTKQFTAAAVMLLQESGKLSVADDIRTYLPDYPTHGHNITIEHLLTHTAGIYNYTDIDGYMEGAQIRVSVTTNELLNIFSHLPMDFAPGTSHKYSNSGYAILGAIIEKVSGQTYAEFVQDAIFDKLGMHNSAYGGAGIIPKRVDGYRRIDGQLRHAAYIDMSHPHGAGALLSTVDDLARWNNALHNEKLLSEASVGQMLQNFNLSSGDLAGYGYGFFLGERFGQQMIYHTGGIHGFSSSVIWLPESRVFVAILSNDENSQMTRFLSHRLAFDAADADMPRFEPVELSRRMLRSYVGEYQISDGGQIRAVLLKDGRLYTRRQGGNRSAVVAHDTDSFFYPGSFTHLKFVRDPQGRVIAMEMYHDGATEAERAERISSRVNN